MAALSAAMFALRPQLSIATVALVLVIPVVVGVVAGGAAAGAVAVLGGFLVYDVGFIPPYGTLAVGSSQNWVALGVYVVVVVLLGRVTSNLTRAQADARQRQVDAEQLFQMSELLVGGRPLRELLPVVASTLREAFGFEGVVVLLPEGDDLVVAAAAGRPLSSEEVASIRPAGGVRTALSGADGAGGPFSVILQVAGRPVGVLGAVGGWLDPHRAQLLSTFANQTAVALERAALREEALRAQVLEEVDGFRQALLGAVSHDLRTPLATIKASASALRDRAMPLSADDAGELLALIEGQSDRLSRMVSNLLDLSRVRAGALELKREPVSPRALVTDALGLLSPPAGAVVLEGLDGLPAVDVDAGLVSEAVVNLIDNAMRYAPAEAAVRVVGALRESTVSLSVVDRGPGIAEGLAGRLLEGPQTGRGNGPGASGLGLVIARAFVEANGGVIRLEHEPGGGTRATIELGAYEPGGVVATDEEQ